jgi:hypothetical protein
MPRRPETTLVAFFVVWAVLSVIWWVFVTRFGF